MGEIFGKEYYFYYLCDVKRNAIMRAFGNRQVGNKRKSMEKIEVNVSWCDKNFGASLGENVPGAVVITAKSYDELLDAVRETLKFHVEGMVADGDDVPQWLRDGDYEFEFHLDAAALLQMCSPYASIAAISRASGINQHLLSHYANGIKKPRQAQRKRIIEGIHRIGRELIAVE